MTEDPRDPRFTIEEGDKLLATAYNAATAAQIVTEHNLLNQARTQGANWTIEEWQQWQTTL